MDLFFIFKILLEIILVVFVCSMIAHAPVRMEPWVRWALTLVAGIIALVLAIHLLSGGGLYLHHR